MRTMFILFRANNGWFVFLPGPAFRQEPVIKCCLFLSFFQCLVSRAPLSAVKKSFFVVTLPEAIKGIPDKDYNFLGND